MEDGGMVGQENYEVNKCKREVSRHIAFFSLNIAEAVICS